MRVLGLVLVGLAVVAIVRLELAGRLLVSQVALLGCGQQALLGGRGGCSERNRGRRAGQLVGPELAPLAELYRLAQVAAERERLNLLLARCARTPLLWLSLDAQVERLLLFNTSNGLSAAALLLLELGLAQVRAPLVVFLLLLQPARFELLEAPLLLLGLVRSAWLCGEQASLEQPPLVLRLHLQPLLLLLAGRQERARAAGAPVGLALRAQGELRWLEGHWALVPGLVGW